MKMKKLSLVYKTFVPVIIQKKIKDYCDLDHGGDAGVYRWRRWGRERIGRM